MVENHQGCFSDIEKFFLLVVYIVDTGGFLVLRARGDDMVADGLIIHFCYYVLLIFRFVDGGGLLICNMLGILTPFFFFF